MGICFPCNDNMGKCITTCSLRNKASRALFAFVTKSRKLGLHVYFHLQLFDSWILAIALYGCEVWGFRNIEVVYTKNMYCTVKCYLGLTNALLLLWWEKITY